MESKIEELENIINVLENRISKIEKFFTCYNCKKIDKLFKCSNCYEKICCSCYNITYKTNGESLYICNKCK